MIHYFSENVLFEGPYEFTDPFRYIPHQLVVKAAEDIFRHAPECFDEGKMLGVLICRDIATKKIGYLKSDIVRVNNLLNESIKRKRNRNLKGTRKE